jgi:hypothetical protein
MPRVIVCDVNETLLDVGALEPRFKETFGDGRVLQEWFTTVLLYSEVATLAGPYNDFATIAGAALDMVSEARGVALSANDRGRILQGMLSLPAHPDVRDGLEVMRDAGLRLVTLTNSAPTAVQQQLQNAGSRRSSSDRSQWTPSVVSSRLRRRTARWPTHSDFPLSSCALSRRMPGTSSVHSAQGAPRRLSRGRARRSIRWVRSPISPHQISEQWRNGSPLPK